MALGSNPSRDQIWSELGDSTYRNGGTNINSLKNMDAYIFGGDGSGYSRDGFGGYGTPTVSSLTATGGNGVIDLSWTTDVAGTTGNVTYIAQHWVSTNDVTPSPYYQNVVSTSAGSGARSGQISSNVSNGTTYEVRLTAYNEWNNYTTNIPAPRSTAGSWDWTNTDTATPSQPTLSTPQLIQGTAENFNTDLDLTFSCGGNQDNLVVQYRINGGTAENATIQCSANIGSTSPEVIVQTQQFLQGETVEARAKATGAGYADSPYGSWGTLSYGTVRSCPI